MASSVDFNHEPKRHDTFTNVDIVSNYSVPPATSTALNSKTGVPQRPQYLARVPSVQTRYMEMLLHLDKIPRLHNILASAFTWILLASFLVVPGTYTKVKTSQAFKDANNSNESSVASDIVHSIANIGLLWVSGFLALVGATGCFYMWFRWRQNYVWLINRIFLPATLNSVAGLLTTVVNVYTAQKGIWSITAKITAIVTGSCVGVAGGLFALYNFWVLQKVRQKHERSLDPVEIANEERDKKRESILEKVKRKAHEPPIQPGSVV